MSETALSVIIPAYNRAAYLGAAIDSVLAQVPRPVEVIVVDDGSTDASPAIARAYGPSVRLIRQAHAGIGAARNRGLEAAGGEIIGWLDSDDLWPPGSVACRLETLDRRPEVEVVHGRTQMFVSAEVEPDERARLICPSEPQPGYLAGAMLVRRSVLDRVGGFDVDLHTGEFIDWWLRCRSHGVAEQAITEVVLYRRLHAGNHTRADRSGYARVIHAHLLRQRRC